MRMFYKISDKEYSKYVDLFDYEDIVIPTRQTIKNNLKELGIKDSGERIYEVLKGMILDDKKFF